MSHQKKKTNQSNEGQTSKQKGSQSNENSGKKEKPNQSEEQDNPIVSQFISSNMSPSSNQITQNVVNAEITPNGGNNIVYIDPQVVTPASEKNPLENINTPIFENSMWLNKTGQKKKAGVYPTKRWGHTSVVYEKYIYIYGGCGKQQDCSKTMQVFRLDCESYEWNKVDYTTDIVPDTRDSHSANIINNKMWIFGGSNSELLYNEFWTFDLQKNEWQNPTSLFKGEIPSPREGHASAVLHERYLIIIGGFNSETEQIYQDVYVIDTKNKISKNIGTIRMPVRESQSVCVVEDCIYLFGGQGHNEEYYNDLHRLKIENIKKNPSLNVEEIKTKSEFVPSKRSSHQSVAFQNRYIFILGGEKGEIDANNMVILNDIWVYDTRMNFWHEIKPKVQKGVQFKGRFSFSASIYKDKMIVYGGMQNQNSLLEDIMVLHLRDETKQLLIEDRNQCNMCDSIYGLSLNGIALKNDMIQEKRKRDLYLNSVRSSNFLTTTASHQSCGILDNQDLDYSSTLPNKKQQESRYTEDSLVKLPYTNSSVARQFKYVSSDFIKSLANMISSPFQAIGLLFNFLFSLSDQVFIEIKEKGNPLDTTLFLYENEQGANHKDFQKYICSFSHARYLEFDKYNKDREPYMKENDRMIQISDLSNQIKIAGCRLGEQMILQSRHLNTISVGVINFKNNSNNIEEEEKDCKDTNMLELYYYSYDEQNKKYLTQDGEQMQKIIERLIDNDYFDFQKDSLTQGFSIRIRNLSQITDLKANDSQMQQELSTEILYDSAQNDITLNAPTYIGPQGVDGLNQTIDYSFKLFSKFYYYKPTENKQLFLNKQRIEFISYYNSLQEIQTLTLVENIINPSELSQLGELTLYSQKTDKSNQENQPQNGCLAYYDNRFAFRFGSETQLGFPSLLRIQNKYLEQKPIYLVHGSLLLSDFLKPNVVYSVNLLPYI